MNRLFIYKNFEIQLLEGDLTSYVADVLVNAANETLVGDDGVDGALHIAAGPKMQQECNKTGYCPVTDVVVTKAYNLPAQHVFHTVGPQWNGDKEVSELLLRITYYNNLKKAEQMKVKSIAFPSISTGQYGVPTHIGAESFVNAITWFHSRQQPNYLRNITVVTHYDPDFDERTDIYQQFEKALFKIHGSNND